MAVRITTLGTLRVELDGRVLDRLPAARNRSALLVHLALEREITRDAAMGLLWPDRPPARARHLLSQTLYELRQELGEDWVETRGEQLRATDALRADAVELAAAVEAGDHDRAVALYGGEFLPGASLAVSRAMEGWIDGQQARLTRLHRKARRRAIDDRVAAGQLPEALALARSWAEADPLDDEAQHRLIELLAATGDRSAALRQYEEYARLVEAELELEPLEDTRALVERIRDGEVGARPQSPVPDTASAAPAPAGTEGPAEDAPVGAAVRAQAALQASVQDGSQPVGQDGAAGAPDAAAPAPLRGVDGLLDRIASLGSRRSVQWTLGYLALAVVLLQGTEVLIDRFALPGMLLRGLALALALGAIGVLGAAWYMGKNGRRFGAPEAALTFLVAAFMLSLPGWFGRAAPSPAEAGTLSPNRLAVLYFDDLSPDQSLGPLASGFTEALIHELSQVEGLDVLSRRAVAPFRENQEVPYDSLVSVLRAGILVEGSLTRIQDRIRLTIQLIEGASSSHLMSTTLESASDSVDQLLVAMPEEAARLLRKRLGGWVRLQAMETAASSARALEIVQRAEPLLADARAVRRADLDASLPLLDRADSLLAEAERLDAGWPEPIMMRAEVAKVRALATAAVPSQYEPAATQRAFEHLGRVLERWPGHAAALALRGDLRFGLAESGAAPEAELEALYRDAEADLRKAVLEDEDLTEGWWGLSKVLLHNYEYAEARRAAVRALETDAYLGTDADQLLHLFWVTFNAEDHPAAIQWCDELGERYPTDTNYQYCRMFLLTSSPLVVPDVDAAWEVAREIVEGATRSSRDIYRGYTALQVTKVIIRAGLPDSARAVIRRAVPEPTPAWAPYDLAHAHLLLGEEDIALDYLEQWFELNPVRARRLGRDWWFTRLRGHPRFEQMIGAGAG